MKKGSFLIAAMMRYIGSLKTVYTLPNSLGRGNRVGFLGGSLALLAPYWRSFLGVNSVQMLPLFLLGFLPSVRIVGSVT